MKKIFKFIVLFPKLTLALSLAISIIIGIFSYKLEIDASTQTLLLENDKDLAIYREITKRYESKNFLIIAYRPNSNLLSQSSLDKIAAISKDLENLPMVGRKTTNVVLSELFNEPTIAVDTHVERVSKRLGLVKKDDDVIKIEEKLKRKFDKNIWSKLHKQFVLFGRYYCTSKKPSCNKCKLQIYCKKEF